MRYLVLFLPFMGASMLSFDSTLSYWCAWLGSFWIIFWIFSGKIYPLQRDVKGNLLLLRPIMLPHLILAGYMAISSVFHFLDANGYYYFEFDPSRQASDEQLSLIATCQRLYCLAHASFVAGLIAVAPAMARPQWRTSVPITSGVLLVMTVLCTVFFHVFRVLPGMSQFQQMLEGLSMVCSVMALAVAIPEQNWKSTLPAAGLFGLHIITALLAGWKEAVIVPVLMLCIFMYPYYRKTVLMVGPVVMLFLFTVLPTFVGVIRQQTWGGDASSDEAASEALKSLQSRDTMRETNWEFLTNRISEIGMFKRYVEFVPARRDYYYFQIISQGLLNVVPRVIYPGKPVTEVMVMERVYEAGIVDVHSVVSAKPPLVTDGYLSGGTAGVFLFFIGLGLFSAWVCAEAENLFGGYTIGTCIIFTGLFQIIWRPNCFEFMFNSLVWSLIFMLLLHQLGRKAGWIISNRQRVTAKVY